jgi:lipopolysaccharide biosynthesis glycosyltransferase
MNIAYILISSTNDTFYEQTAISIMSLRKFMKDADVFVLADRDTISTFTGRRTIFEKLNVTVVPVDVPEQFNNRDRSRFIKTSMNKYLPRNFVYIDCDTVLDGSLESLPADYEISMVLNRHLKISESPVKNFFENNAKRMNWHSGYDDRHFNGGFMCINGSEKTDEFFATWHTLWNESREKTKGTVFDQTSLNEANFRFGGIIHEISGIYNCQVSRNSKCMKFVHDAKVLHLFTNPRAYAHDLSKPEIIKSVLDENHAELDEILENPKAAFCDIYDLNTDFASVEMTKSPAYTLLLSSYKGKRIAFSALNFFAKILSRFGVK